MLFKNNMYFYYNVICDKINIVGECMKEYIGKVIEVFIPTNENTNVMDSNEIGFKVQMDNDIIEIDFGNIISKKFAFPIDFSLIL